MHDHMQQGVCTYRCNIFKVHTCVGTALWSSPRTCAAGAACAACAACAASVAGASGASGASGAAVLLLLLVLLVLLVLLLMLRARDVSLISATFYDLQNSLALTMNHCEKTMLVMWLQQRDVPSGFHSACPTRCAFSGVI